MNDPKLELPEKILMFTKKLPSHESLFIIQNYNFELREILQNKQELLKEMEMQRFKDENELKSLEFAITNVKAETEKLKLLLGEDIETENYWEEQLKQEEKKKLASVQEYQIKMAEYRNQLFSSIGINEEALIIETDEMSSQLEVISKEVDETKLILNGTIEKFHAARLSFDQKLIDNIQMLSDEIVAQNEARDDCGTLESEIKRITEQMKFM